MRTVRATLLGVGIAIALVVMLEAISAQIWPFMSRVDMQNDAAVRAAIASAPVLSMLWVVAAYAVAGFIGSFLACKMAGGIKTRPSWIVATVLFAGCVSTALSIPQPLWMDVASLAVPFPVAWLGIHTARVG